MTKLVLALAIALAGARPALAGEVNQAALAHLVERGRAAHSSALLVWHRGKLIVEEYFGEKPHLGPLMSMTKSVVALGVARLVDKGKLRLDQPVSDFYPEWKQGRKGQITLRHILNHTSGLQNFPDTGVEIYPAPDAIKLALAAELSDAPGKRFSYNNKAVNLLAGIIEIASGRPMDRYIFDTILRPIGIRDGGWFERDAAGHPYAMSGLALKPADVIRIGRLLLGRGSFGAKRILSERVVAELLAPGLDPTCGLLWWRMPRSQKSVVDDKSIADMRKHRVDERTIADLTKIKDRPLVTAVEFEAAMKRALGARWRDRVADVRNTGARETTRINSPDIVAYDAIGSLGQFLIVIPAAQLVAVRMVDSTESYDEETDVFGDFFDSVRALVE